MNEFRIMYNERMKSKEENELLKDDVQVLQERIDELERMNDIG